ncbi:MAG TPA: class I SAM-dependent methyltransferase [Solirubrobacteraceae bacterium]|nr:class I SAM-dependent methyltransferase [Solirubrobacteraceae bacterium]
MAPRSLPGDPPQAPAGPGREVPVAGGAELHPRPLPSGRPVAAVVGDVLDRVAHGALSNRPFGLRFWDGSELPATAAGGTATGVSDTGVPAAGVPAAGVPAAGVPAAGVPAAGVSDTGVPAAGVPTAGRSVTVVVTDPQALAHAAREPNEIGLARAWALGEIELEGDLDEMFAIGEEMPRARISPVDALRALGAAWRLLGGELLHAPPVPEGEIQGRHGPRHSRRRDRAAVRHHYDVPTAFHRLVIGPSMVYSCAYFTSPTDTLEEAQGRKLDVICRKLRLGPGMRLLDVGCGWGSLVVHAARRYGVRAVGVTLSEPQAEEARGRIAAAGADVAGRCEIRVADYREVDDGPYDAVASVGMYEHVGRDQLDTYAATIRRLLAPGGLFLNHGIARLTPREQGSRFIDRFIFPDGELHPVGALIAALERQRLEVRDVEALREHYALTLRRWIENLRRNRPRAVDVVGSQRERIWRLYLVGSARAFEQGRLSLFQVLATRPDGPHRLPLARGDAAAVPSGG